MDIPFPVVVFDHQISAEMLSAVSELDLNVDEHHILEVKASIAGRSGTIHGEVTGCINLYELCWILWIRFPLTRLEMLRDSVEVPLIILARPPSSVWPYAERLQSNCVLLHEGPSQIARCPFRRALSRRESIASNLDLRLRGCAESWKQDQCKNEGNMSSSSHIESIGFSSPKGGTSS